MLAAGGNAVDAVCAAACAAAVAEAPLTGPGAGGFLLWRPPTGPATLLDFFVATPGLGPSGRRLDPAALDTFTVPFGDADQEFHIGPASVAVPGMMHGIDYAVERYGRLRLADVVEPAVRLARDGVVITPEVAYLHEILAAMLVHTRESAALFAPHGRTYRPGERFAIPELAETYRQLAAEGAAAIATGGLGHALIEHIAPCGGLVTPDDLAGYGVIERPPLELDHAGATILTNPPPSAGGLLIAAALSTVDPGAVGDEAGYYATVTAAGVHANALRTTELHDALWDDGVVERLLRNPTRKPTGTTHVSAIDADGGMAGLSSSCGSGGGVVVPGTGILLNNMMGEADLNPSGFGLLPPGVRMTSMMAPTVVTRSGLPLLALGSAGSNRLRSAILQTLVSVVDGGMDVARAVSRPRVHPEGDGVDVEAGVPDEVCAALRRSGHRLRRWTSRNLFFGGVSAVAVTAAGMWGAGDPRRGGGAVGVTGSGEVVDL